MHRGISMRGDHCGVLPHIVAREHAVDEVDFPIHISSAKLARIDRPVPVVPRKHQHRRNTLGGSQQHRVDRCDHRGVEVLGCCPDSDSHVPARVPVILGVAFQCSRSFALREGAEVPHPLARAHIRKGHSSRRLPQIGETGIVGVSGGHCAPFCSQEDRTPSRAAVSFNSYSWARTTSALSQAMSACRSKLVATSSRTDAIGWEAAGRNVTPTAVSAGPVYRYATSVPACDSHVTIR